MTYDGPWMINDAAKDNPYQYNGKELNLDHGLNWSDYGARWYDVCLGRWSSVDPLAEKFPGYSAYNYALNNPIRLIDPDGRAPAGYGDPIAGIKQTLANTAATVQRNVTDAVNYTRNKVAPAVGSAAGVVGEIADYVQYAALAVTALTGGASSPGTVPIAVGAELVGNGALAVQVIADGVENGNFKNTGSEAVVKAIAGPVGFKVSKSIQSMEGVSKVTKDATEAIAQTMVNTTEKVTNNVISNIKIDKKSSTSTNNSPSLSTYKFTVTDSSKRN